MADQQKIPDLPSDLPSLARVEEIYASMRGSRFYPNEKRRKEDQRHDAAAIELSKPTAAELLSERTSEIAQLYLKNRQLEAEKGKLLLQVRPRTDMAELDMVQEDENSANGTDADA